MRITVALAAAALIASPASALQKLGARTIPPEQILKEYAGTGVSDGEMDREIAEASTHPLGSAQNPVRVGGPEGERAYLARLRCADGSNPKIGAGTEAGVGAFGTIVQSFAIDCGAAAPGRTLIVMDMYHEDNAETHAPAGFTLSR